MNLKQHFHFCIAGSMLAYLTCCHVMYADSQTQNKCRIHEESMQTETGLVKANILDFSKKITKPREYLLYYWFQDNNIKISVGGFSGKLLHGKYSSFYPSKNLKELGNFCFGLKNGTWKKWYENGVLNTSVVFQNGIKQGVYKEYDIAGNLYILGRYRKGQLQGHYRTFKDGKVVKKYI